MFFDPDKEPDNEAEDYFENTPEVEPVKKEPKQPEYKPDDPAYWEQEDSDWKHLWHGSKRRIWIWGGVCLVVLILVTAFWLRYFSPYVEDATQYGYVESIERRGNIFQTYEGVLIPYKELFDTTRIYRRDFMFTAADSKTATRLKEMMFAARPVRVTYKQYHAVVPWRGSSKIIITRVDSVSPDSILPPDFPTPPLPQ